MEEDNLRIGDLPPLTHPASKKRSPNAWAIMVIGCVLAIVNLGLGGSLIFSLPSRTAAASFDPLKQVMSVFWWGIAFLSTGIFAILAQVIYRPIIIAMAHVTAGSFCIFWTFAFCAGLSNPNASATGIWAYLGLGLTHWVIGVTTYMGSLRTRRA